MTIWQKVLFGIILVITAGSLYINYKKPIKEGLDIQGGIHLVLQAKPTEDVKVITPQVMQAAVAVVRSRVDQFGVSEPLIQLKGSDQIIVDLAGIKDTERAVKLLGETAMLDFREEVEIPSFDKTKTTTEWKKTKVTGKMLTDAKATIRPNGADWIIEFTFNAEGAKLFGELTSRIVHKRLGIFLDDKLVSAPEVKSPITGGSGIIEGNFGAEEAKDLAIKLKAGQLPVPLEMIENRTVGPTLGQESVDKSFIAGIIGLILVLIFMGVYYRLAGLISDLSLFIYASITLCIFKLIPVTLTVPGIAGFILSIGMAVDANILIFERTKEELRSGKSIFNAVENGFQRAFPSIFDSNMTTLISCLVLYNFGTGLIRGFALTLAIGVIVSMFTAITVTRNFMRFIITFKKLKNPKLYGVTLKPITPKT